MRKVIFTREFRHVLPGHRTAIYPPDIDLPVDNDVFEAATKAKALKPKPKEEPDGDGPAPAD